MPKKEPNFSLACRSQLTLVKDRLYLSGYSPVLDGKVQENQITLVINSTVDLPLEPIDSEIKVIRVALRDELNFPIFPHLESTADLIAQHLAQPESGSVLVHCAAGISRSASLIIAYLIKHQHHSLRTAFELVQKARPIIRPNNFFFEQLIDFERTIHGSSDCRMVLVQRYKYAAKIPSFFLGNHERLILLETIKQRLPVIPPAINPDSRSLSLHLDHSMQKDPFKQT